MLSKITYELDGPIALVGINRPEKRNAIGFALDEELRHAIERACQEATVGVIFGHGDHFSAGLDLADALAMGSAPRATRPRPRISAQDVIARGGIPFVAALQGAVVGGGWEIAAAAHIRVADETAFFALPEGQRGIYVGGGGSVRIASTVGYPLMADLMLTGRVLSAQEAFGNKVFQYLTPKGAALARAKELATKISQNAPYTNFAVTNGLPRLQDVGYDDGLFFEFLLASYVHGPESQTRLSDFLEKRAKPLEAP